MVKSLVSMHLFQFLKERGNFEVDNFRLLSYNTVPVLRAVILKKVEINFVALIDEHKFNCFFEKDEFACH